MAQIINPNEVDWDAWSEINEAATIKPASSWADEVKTEFENGGALNGLKLPWDKTHDLVRIRPAEVSIWTGENFSGKSVILSQCIAHLCGFSKTLIASYEMPPRKTMARMSRQTSGASRPADAFIDKFSRWTDDKLWLYDHVGDVLTNRVFSMINYGAQELGIEQFVIDSMMKVRMGSEDYSQQKFFINKLCDLAQAHNVHVHLVAHSKKPGGEADRKTRGSRYGVKGASEITDQVDNVFVQWRNEDKEDRVAHGGDPEDPAIKFEPDAVLRCDKQRHGEWVGDINLWFRPPSMQFVDKPSTRSIPWPNAEDHWRFMRDDYHV